MFLFALADRRRWWWLPVLAALVLGGRCTSLSVEEAPSRPTPLQPLWDEEGLREHLRFFNGSDVEGRATGTAGYAVAAAYVAARMAEFGLQPVLNDEYRVVYETAIHDVRAARLAAAGTDTLVFQPGVDFLPDGRSDSGRVQVDALVIDPAGYVADREHALPGPAVLMPAPRAETGYLRALRRAGTRVVFEVGALAPRLATAPLQDLLVVQLAPHAASRLLRAPPGAVREQLQGDARTVHPLPQPVQLQVEAYALPHAGAINVLGFTAGRQPEHAKELVVVCTGLDAVGSFAGVRTLDAGHFGVATAALLEVARQYAYFAQYTRVPERSILFAVFSGTHQDYAGLRAYLRHPLWALDQTRAVIYAGLDPADRSRVRDLLSAYDLPLYVVEAPPDSLVPERTVLLTDRRPPRQRTIRTAAAPERPAPPRLSDLIEAGVRQARQMADSLNALLLSETVTPAPFQPALADTLAAPAPN